MGCCATKDDAMNPSKKKGESATKQIKRKYHIHSKVLGSGGFGKVFLAESVADPNFKVAIKAIGKAKLGNDIDLLKKEIKIL
jgi:serine/threonine protein kinase